LFQASLEHILLDAKGTVRPHFDPGDEINAHPQYGSIVSEYNDSPRDSQIRPISRRSCSPGPPFVEQDSQTKKNGTHEEGYIIPNNEELPQSRKRKLDQPYTGSSLLELEMIETSDHLPSQPLLEKLVDYFCVSFHHWIPYLHKQKLQNSVHNGSRNPQLDLVLHALVVVTLRHVDGNVSFLDEDQILHQTRISRYIVERFAMRTVSLESLQALIMIVFDYVSFLDLVLN
jgi:hypothetical protein